jgi:hypothetical protein
MTWSRRATARDSGRSEKERDGQTSRLGPGRHLRLGQQFWGEASDGNKAGQLG